MDAFYERLIERAATIDERLSGEFESLPGRKDDADLAARRLAAWCNAAANGDWTLFGRRLGRDGLSFGDALVRLATIRRNPAAQPAWIDDAIWIEQALRTVAGKNEGAPHAGEPAAFEDLLFPVVKSASEALWTGVGARASGNFTEAARAGLSRMLLDALSDLCAPALYERFAKMRAEAADGPPSDQGTGTVLYRRFVSDMRTGGIRRLFEERPVLLRLIATLTRQWIDVMGEFARRLDADLDVLRRELVPGEARSRVARVEGDLSDRHNGGRTVLIVIFDDGARVVYKPKDLRLDAAWHALIDRLNASAPPVELRAARAIAREHYGWTEFIAHAACADQAGCERYFRRMGAWLALLHGFAATDMHQENVIAAGDHPVPIDLETLLQSPAGLPKSQDAEGAAADAATAMIANSVMAVGILPAYGRAPDTSVFAMGAMTADWNAKIKISWSDINSDGMRPAKTKIVGDANPNLPHVAGGYARFPDHFDAFIAGFEDYARFLSHRTRGPDQGGLFEGFAGVPVRKVARPTRFYSMLLQRLENYQSMDDGATWSAQADFMARLSDWNSDSDPIWPLQRSERSALLTLNVPHFVAPSDGAAVQDADSTIMTSAAKTSSIMSGLDHARERLRNFDAGEIGWQAEVIRANAATAKPTASADAAALLAQPAHHVAADARLFAAEAGRIAASLSEYAIRRGPGAAWIGLDWLGDAEAFQLVCLGPDLYNGVSGIALFLAAHASVTRHAPSGELALAAIAHLRRKLKDRNAPRFARSLGIGGAGGMGSLVYALTVIGRSLDDAGVLADAHAASALMTDDLIAADKRLDVIGGAAGGILGLLRLYRETGEGDVLARAVACGEHLLRQERAGPVGRRNWVVRGLGPRALNGMSHGAAGFAYALASLAAATGREEFAQAAAESLAFEDASFDAERSNWPDLRHEGEPGWACRWCHGAPGIGLARAAMLKRSAGIDPTLLQDDLRKALAGTERGWPSELDTLCCGTLGSVEFFCEAGDVLDRPDIRDLAAQRLAAVVQAAASAGDYRWNSGKRQFNLGLFRGLSGVGYTLLRRIDSSLPNVLIWE